MVKKVKTKKTSLNKINTNDLIDIDFTDMTTLIKALSFCINDMEEALPNTKYENDNTYSHLILSSEIDIHIALREKLIKKIN
jgi:hypothetical protein